MTDARLASLSLQQLLAERRANLLERMRERDITARYLLAFHVADIDRELKRRDAAQRRAA